MVRQAFILAAGRGERLVNGASIPKPLVKLAGIPLIVRIIRQLERAGVEEVNVVTGYLGHVLRETLHAYPFSLRVSFVHNSDWNKPNGNSVLAAREHIRDEALLLMCDHLWSPSLLWRVASFPIAHDEAVLGVDFNISRCFDVDDATKVRLHGTTLREIGKGLPYYDALDTGVFKITPALMDALASVDGDKGCSLSQGVAKLAIEQRMRVVDVGQALWVDVDTPEAHTHAEKLMRLHGDELRPLPSTSQPQVAA